MIPPTSSLIPSSSRRGMASLLAISLLVLIAAILAALGTMASADARRSRNLQADAQLRQLLTAGAIQAQQVLAHGSAPAHPISMDLPAELGSRGARLSLTFKSDGTRMHVEVRAALGRRGASQTVEFNKSSSPAGKWEIESVNLTGP